MKTILKYIGSLFLTISLLGFSGCDESQEGNMAFSENVDITSFKANGIEGVINDSKQTVDIYLSWSYDLTSLNTEISLPQGAKISGVNNNNVNLSQTTVYRVLNGNLYKDYKVTASYSKMNSFNVGKYNGVIDHLSGTITVKYPKGEPVNSLYTAYSLTPGATCNSKSDERYDYSNPLKFTLSYLNETFDYTVTVVPTDFRPVGFLGVANNASSIENEDEKAAYQWFVNNVPNSKYISFSDISENKVNLSEYSVIWWHMDTDSKDLPSAATSPAVVNSLKNYYQNGGSFFFSSWAVQYVANLGIAKDGKAVNNTWNDGNQGFITGDDWGLCFTGNESHPAFGGLQKYANNKANLLSAGVKSKAHNALWNFDWGDYAHDVPAWTGASGAISLASFHWDDALIGRSVMFEYPKSGTSGATICIGVESYDWYVSEGTNSYQGNLERLTSNILEYLAN